MFTLKKTYTARLARERELSQAFEAAILAGAKKQRQAVKEEFAVSGQGFIHGDFATGEAANIQLAPITREDGRVFGGAYTDATRTEPNKDGSTSPFTAFGVGNTGGMTLPQGSPYPLFWEFGHYNIFINGVVSAPIFQPALERSADTATRSAYLAFIRKARSFGKASTPAPEGASE